MEALHRPAPASNVTLRIGTVYEIDTLCEIDDDAGDLFTRAGLDLDLPPDHEFFGAERARWLRSLLSGRTLVAVAPSGRILGFAASGMIDGEPHLDQLSVRTQYMRLGIGTALLTATTRRARADGASALSLTTYNHLSWNRPFYERVGFSVVPESECGLEMLSVLAHERRWLPLPHQRVAMRMRLLTEH
jgi:GNAT superfamily N-acetyltransferase